MSKQQAPSIGRVVHYVLATGAHRPALILDVTDDGGVSLSVFAFSAEGGPGEYRNVAHDEDAAPLSWHWPEFVKGAE